MFNTNQRSSKREPHDWQLISTKLVFSLFEPSYLISEDYHKLPNFKSIQILCLFPNVRKSWIHYHVPGTCYV